MLSAIIGGGSAIDVPQLRLSSRDQADAFLESYGYLWDLPAHRTALERYRTGAISFIEEELLADEPHVAIPQALIAESDVRQLLIEASRRPRGAGQRWACAILRVMHTLAHSESYFNQRFAREIREQILARFQRHLSVTSTDLAMGTGDDAVPLLHFEVKHSKPLRSVVLKLLQKPENVATDIFDRVGVRFVTRDRLDAIMLVHYLWSHHVVMFANIKPSRSRNTLLNLDWLGQQFERIQRQDQLRGDPQSYAEQREALRVALADQAYPDAPARGYNVFSSSAWRSIQFTCRHLVRVDNPFRSEQRYYAPGSAAAARSEPRELRFFFPFEVQILDQASYQLSRSGRASHEVYKARQRTAVKARVLGSLLSAGREVAEAQAEERPHPPDDAISGTGSP